MSSDSEEKAKATLTDTFESKSEWLKITLIDRVRKAINDLPPDFHLIPSLIPDADEYKVKVAHLCMLADEARGKLHSLNVQIKHEPDNYEELKSLIHSVESVINDSQEKLDLYYDSIARIVDAQVFICKNQFIDMFYGIIIRRAQSTLTEIDGGSFTGNLENTINFLLDRCNRKLGSLKKERRICTGPGNELRKEELKKVTRHLKLLIILLEKKKNPAYITNVVKNEIDIAHFPKRLTQGLFDPCKRTLEELPTDFPDCANADAKAGFLSFLLDMAKDQIIYVNEREDKDTTEAMMIKKEIETVIHSLEEKLYTYRKKKNLDGEFHSQDQLFNVLYRTIIRRADKVLRDIETGKISKNIEKIKESLLRRCSDKCKLLQKEKEICPKSLMETKVKDIEILLETLENIILRLENPQENKEQKL